MSRDASIFAPFGDGEYKFRLAWGELVKLQEALDVGPLFLFNRLGGVEWRVQDIAETLRWGLIGGGTKPADASKLIELYVKGMPPIDNLSLALRVLAASLNGAPDETQEMPPGKADAPNGSTLSPTGNSASEPSTN